MSRLNIALYFLIIFGVRATAYYIVEPIAERSEQSSRDLDLSFSTGQDPDRREPLRLVRPYDRKVYSYRGLENPTVELGLDRMNDYYEISKTPERRAGLFVAPERNRKLVKLNDGHKGEVILELRVTANNDAL